MAAPVQSDLIFDVGMYDGQDTQYYLDSGFRVVGVEASPFTVRTLRQQFEAAIAAGRLTIEAVAIGPTRGELPLYINDMDAGSSSMVASHVDGRTTTRQTVIVPTAPLTDLLERHGVPYYLKVDIEGSDGVCIRALTAACAPPYVSFEIGEDGDELIAHLASIGYTSFKLISQVNFREFSRLERLSDRLVRRLRHAIGRPTSLYVRRAGRQFRVEHSAGPMPKDSDGPWRSTDEVRRQWAYRQRERPGLGGWFDLHARHSSV